MYLASILPHTIAGNILLFYGLLAIAFSQPKRKPPQSVPTQPLTPQNVDLEFCSQEELEVMMGVILKSANQLTLTDDELSRFWSVNKELKRRTQSEGRVRMAKILSFEVSDELYIRIVTQ